MKPADEAKAFNGESLGKEELALWLPIWRESLPSSFVVHCSEVVDMIAEFRAYVCEGQVRSICQYLGAGAGACGSGSESGSESIGGTSSSYIDRSVVDSAARILHESPDGQSLKGCGMDFAIVKRKTRSLVASVSASASIGVIDDEKEEEESYVTALVEVNDGISTGAYEGVSDEDFTDMILV